MINTKQLFLAVLLLSCTGLTTNYLHAQSELEIGLTGGVAGYSGDLRPNEFGLFFEDLEAFGGLYLRFRPTNRIALRLNGVFGRVKATDSRPEQLDLSARTGIAPYNFESSLTEFSLQAELDLFYIGDQNGNHLAPYISGGAGIFTFNPETTREGTSFELRDFRTEGQGIGGDRYDAAPYELTDWTFLLGGGLRWRASDRLVIGVEVVGRRTNTDYLDDISNTRVNYADLLENFGATSASLSNPFITDLTDADTDYVRGGEFNDWYFTGGVTLGIIIGNGTGGSSKTGCYTF
ncbi:MAG: DUF6089 family protein [Bacteroidota bacterium]